MNKLVIFSLDYIYMHELRFFGILFLLILCIFIFTRNVIESFTPEQEAQIISDLQKIKEKMQIN